ncbi:uncharacterized protein LOC113669121 isoform X2 [Pocillopora damicornis]|uniref:uncharacterized protein LOC113669121 isoform X2 n=1 Tax=Pocillopora damicornis TaxID=46731 RepID=UPI000F553122|nr:uncharacterized protein LOC113669121 isoform X2 [Pocillopora damicornis]
MEQKLNFEFRSFLLQLGKELKSQDLEHLKFILTPYVSSAECDKMSFCSYFEELKRRCHLSPTNFGVLKNGLNEIGREDLVEKIVLKELYFSEIFNQIGAPNLGTNDSDMEFDGTANGRHSGKNSPDLQNELLQNEKLMERKKEKTKKTQADYLLKREEGMEVSHDGSIDLHSNEQLTSDEAARDEITESNTTKEEVSDVEMKSTFKQSPKGPCDDKILYHNGPEESDSGKAPINNSGLPDGKVPTSSMSSSNLDSDVVTDSNENGEESAAESKTDGEKFEKKSPVDDNGSGARPKEKKVKTTGPSQTDQGKAMEVDDKVTGTNLYGKLFFANESTKEYELVPPDTKSSKEPTETGYSNPSSPVGTVHEEGSGPDPFYSDNSDVTLNEKPKVPLSGSTHGTHVTMELTKDSSAHSQAELSEIIAALNPSAQLLSVEQKVAFLQNILAMQGNVSGTNPFPNPNSQTDWSQEFGCYHKAGYSVVVTNGQLTESTHDKGMVMMESGTQFCIVIGNENDHAAEVDITFGGMYLGVWALEAKQSISHNPLVIEGSSWADGRLRFFSDVDDNKPKPSADFYGEKPELNGFIELEFKPEVHILKIFAQHVRDQREEKLIPVSIAPSSTTTIGDLKQEISKKWDSMISYLLRGGEILDEGKTISSYALNKNEVIQVVNDTEEIKIESHGMDPIIMNLDPQNVSLDAVKDFIAEKIKIPPDEQLLAFKEQDMDIDGKTLTSALLTSKKTPELKVFKDRNINIDILHDGKEVKVDIKWSATVQELMDRLVERGICDSGATLSLYENNKDISGVGNRKLFDLGLKNKTKIVVSNRARSTHRGFSMSSLSGGPSHVFGINRGFGGLVKPTVACRSMRGFPDSAGTRAGGSCASDAAYDCSQEDGESGIAMLCGDEERVYKNFSLDNYEKKFSKEKAVTLTILLKAKSTGATGGATSSQSHLPSGACSGATGPKSTPYPPPVPD